MPMNKLPLLGEKNFFKEAVNRERKILIIPDTEPEAFSSYKRFFEDNGFSEEEKSSDPKLSYIAYRKENTGVFLNFFYDTKELQIVSEENCKYFDYFDECRANTVTPQITQVHLRDFGMSYAIRLSDGRFIVIDGGLEYEDDAKSLFECLKKGSPFDKPIIAAWIMTHPHSDHFHCFMPFTELFRDSVVIEKMMFNFPESDDLTHYPALSEQSPPFKDNAETVFIPRFLKRINEAGIPIYTPHTGQRYIIGDAELYVLASMDDTLHCSQNINSSSLVLKMQLGGQTVLWTADASFKAARLCERYGDQLKADILQVPHHGFSCGCAEEEIRGFELADPKVCFLPVIDFNAYTAVGIYRESTLYLMTKMRVAEMITGDITRTVTLPYSPVRYGKEELKRNVDEGFKHAGAKNWIFTDLSTANKEDFVFTFLNTAEATAVINAELFFEDSGKRVRFIKITLPRCSVKNDHTFIPEAVQRGIPQNAPFAVRFISNLPVVVSKKGCTATYSG